MTSLKIPIPKPIIDTLDHIDEHTNTAINKSDYLIAVDFLKQYKNNKATFESYRREIERLLQWSWLLEKKSILELKRQDIENYISFCLNPVKSWIGTKRVARFIERMQEFH